jgi:hypothetical protein
MCGVWIYVYVRRGVSKRGKKREIKRGREYNEWK